MINMDLCEGHWIYVDFTSTLNLCGLCGFLQKGAGFMRIYMDLNEGGVGFMWFYIDLCEGRRIYVDLYFRGGGFMGMYMDLYKGQRIYEDLYRFMVEATDLREFI